MKTNLTSYFLKKTLRVKITGKCNTQCAFCHEEGAMSEIDDIHADKAFFTCIKNICFKEHVRDIVLTGGEPTLNVDLAEIILGIRAIEGIETVRLVTNGTRDYSHDIWARLLESGLSFVTFSIHSTGRALAKQKQNIHQLESLGIRTKINIVAFDTVETLNETYIALSEFESTDIVLLNNVYAVENSKHVIKHFLEMYDFTETAIINREETSNIIKKYTNTHGKILFVKQHSLYRHPMFCCDCSKECHEGYYGLRLEKRKDQYFIRTCLDRSDLATLILADKFCLR